MTDRDPMLVIDELEGAVSQAQNALLKYLCEIYTEGTHVHYYHGDNKIRAIALRVFGPARHVTIEVLNPKTNKKYQLDYRRVFKTPISERLRG